MIEWAVAALLGLLFGSFLNVVILRIPKGESVVFGASHCYSCGNSLKPWHNIPLFSWLFLRGKCSFCKTKISIQYP
ncbi:MAG: prepilin peptidase, partial [Bacteroidota bacterium]|nr:prepilin peptidase [Bacteroidota bacterium]